MPYKSYPVKINLMASLNELRSPAPTNGSVSAFSLPSSIGVKRGPQGIPTVQTLQNPSLHNRVKEPMVNSTAARPYMIRRYSKEYEKSFFQGDLMFVRVGKEQDYNMSRGVYDFANLQLLNYHLKKNAGNEKKALEYLKQWRFIGIMENKMETGRGMDDMILINVRGRARCCNIWKVKDSKKQLTKGTTLYLTMSLKQHTGGTEKVRDPFGFHSDVVLNDGDVHGVVNCESSESVMEEMLKVRNASEGNPLLKVVPVGVVSLNNRSHAPKHQRDAHHYFDHYRQLMNNHPLEVFMRI